MKKIPSGLVLAAPVPNSEDGQSVRAALEFARAKNQTVRVLIGVGDNTDGRMPLRMLGYASKVVSVVGNTLPTILGRDKPQYRFDLFSSAPKIAALANRDVSAARHRGKRLLWALAGSLRIAGFDGAIHLRLAHSRAEVPPSMLHLLKLPHSLKHWLQSAASRNQNGADHLSYAAEHAAMFEDVSINPPKENSDLRFFVGGCPEARFWAVRRALRHIAYARGMQVNPVLGLIIRSLRQPYYHPIDGEPIFQNFLQTNRSELSANFDGLRKTNFGLKKEIYLTKSLVAHPLVKELAQWSKTRSESFLASDRITEEWDD